MIKVAFCSYFWENCDIARKELSCQTPNNSYTWGDISAVTEHDNPDYFVIFQSDTEYTKDLPPEKKIYLQREPNDIESMESYKARSNGFVQSYEKSFQFTKWWVNSSYDELVDLPFPNKNKSINTILSHKRDVPGHVLRSDFVIDFMERYPGTLDLYGSLAKTYPILKHIRKYPLLETIYNQYLKLPFVNTFVDFDKLQITLPYRYSFVAENSFHKNYFTEKIVDAYLSWSMPIYWGCPNISDYFPEDSYYTIDINDANAHERLWELSQRPLSDRNIKAIGEARNRILNEYNIWPALESYIKNEL